MNDWKKDLKKWAKMPFVKMLKKQLPEAEIFLVGGALRDAIIGKETADFDFVIRGVSKIKLEKFLSSQGRVDLVGKKFGVYKFRPKGYKGIDLDIALPRTEHSIHMSGARKDFKIQSNSRLKIQDDLSRRDFTINAMAWDIFEEKLIDPFNGFSDIKKKIIRAVGIPYLRFKEDYSRMLRAIRFSCQLDFELAQTCWQGIKTGMKQINIKVKDKRVVPYEVISKEMIKAMHFSPIKALEMLDESGAIQALMPELLKMKKCPQPKTYHAEGDVWTHTALALENLNLKEFKKEFGDAHISNEVIWALLFHDIGKPFTMTKTDRIRFNNHDNVGAEKFREIAKLLRLSAGGLNIDVVDIIIKKHMLLAHANVDEIKATTIEKYFFNELFPGQELLMVMFADISATINQKTKKPDFSDYKKLTKKLNTLAKNPSNKKLARPLINGHDIIKILKIQPGHQIGELLNVMREAQLKGKIKTKKQALDLLKKHL